MSPPLFPPSHPQPSAQADLPKWHPELNDYLPLRPLHNSHQRRPPRQHLPLHRPRPPPHFLLQHVGSRTRRPHLAPRRPRARLHRAASEPQRFGPSRRSRRSHRPDPGLLRRQRESRLHDQDVDCGLGVSDGQHRRPHYDVGERQREGYDGNGGG